MSEDVAGVYSWYSALRALSFRCVLSDDTKRRCVSFFLLRWTDSYISFVVTRFVCSLVCNLGAYLDGGIECFA